MAYLRPKLLTHCLAFCIALGAGNVSASAQEPSTARQEPMTLGVAAAFSQGSREANWRGLDALSLQQFRAGIRWGEVERKEGQYRLPRPRHLYPDRLEREGRELVLTLNFGNPLYDDGHTPHSPEAVAAFGRFAAAMVERFPAITAVEVGNEFNGNNFVTGPVKDAGLAARGAYHLAMVRSAARAVRAVRPEIPVLGGATHSIPAGYLWPILDAGAGDMDGIALHPYTTPIDQLPAQISVLRRHPAMQDMPIWVTEWGSENIRQAPDDLVRGYLTMAALGFRALYWYPLSDRGDGLVPLLDNVGNPTTAGQAFAFVQSQMADKPVTDISPDAFTIMHRVGPNMVAIWGEPRPLDLRRDDIAVFNARGQEMPATGLLLSRTKPMILRAPAPIDPAHDIALGCQDLVADTRDQFTFPPDDERAGSGFVRKLRIGGEERDFVTLPGQQRSGTPWTPYLGLANRLSLRLTARGMIPAGRARDDLAIIHRFTAPAPMQLQLNASLSVGERSSDGINVTITQGARALLLAQQTRNVAFSEPIALAAGETVAITVSGGEEQRGDHVRYRYQLRDLERCAF